MSEFMLKALWRAFVDTLTMVGISGVLVWFAGIALAMILITTARGAIFEAPTLNRVLGGIVNGFRATPFIILLVALIPLTRLLTGTTIGVWAAVVPITLSA